MRTLLSILALSLCLGGCSRVGVIVADGELRRTAIPRARQSTFQPGEYAAFDGEGTGTIEGVVVVMHPDGNPWLGAVSEVLLTPVTSYSSEWFERSVIDDEPLETMDVRAGIYNRSTVADYAGRFRFERLKPGDYFVSSVVQMLTPVHAGSIGGKALPPKSSTVLAHARVSVLDGDTTTVVVSR